MVHCLTLISRTHRIARRAGGRVESVCGLAVADADAGDLFVADEADATCARCAMAASAAVVRAATARPADVARALFAALVSRETGAASDLLGRTASLPGGARGFDGPLRFGQAVERLHALFAGWTAQIVDLMVDGDRVLVRYRASGNDHLGLLGLGERFMVDEGVILTVHDGQAVAASAMGDTFGFWAAATCDPRNPVDEEQDVG